ncbi:MAG TPA: alpha/beta hydrolase [Thermoanaerobaculia bacterium]|jgi:pimeloyl-ACP methyl ester carboxylesterase
MIALVLAAVLTLQPCEVRDVKAQCGTLAVPENPSRRATRFIDLNLVVVPARSKHNDALFILAGGPGGGATNMTSWAVRTFGAGERDIVLVDMRGTGRSNPLRCDDPPRLYDDLFEPSRLAACRDKLAAKADLTQYTTLHAVRDLEAVRKALGYRTMTLYGTSYGTRVAQEYMRRHPKSIRAAILDGVVPPSLVMPTRYAEGAQRSLARVLALCKADEACHIAYPELEGDLAKVLREAEDGVTIDGETLPRGLFGEAFRNFLYSPEAYTKLPHALHAAAAGDWAPLGEMAQRYARNIRTIDLGLFLSVTCAEDLPRVDEAAVRKGATGTVLGTYRLDQQLGACRVWPRATSDAAMAKPVRSSIPTLIVSGELDPVTPPEYGDEVARTLRRSLHVVIPSGSHSGDTGGCQEQVLSEFVREGSVDALDVTCMPKVKRPPFR